MAGIRIIQLNCQRSYGVMMDLGIQLVERRISVAMLQEPYVTHGNVRGLPPWMRVYGVGKIKAAIVICDETIEGNIINQWSDELTECVAVSGSFGQI